MDVLPNSFNLANNKISMDPDGNWMNKIYNEAELARWMA